MRVCYVIICRQNKIRNLTPTRTNASTQSSGCPYVESGLGKTAMAEVPKCSTPLTPPSLSAQCKEFKDWILLPGACWKNIGCWGGSLNWSYIFALFFHTSKTFWDSYREEESQVRDKSPVWFYDQDGHALARRRWKMGAWLQWNGRQLLCGFQEPIPPQLQVQNEKKAWWL